MMTDYRVERHVAYDMARHYGISHLTAVDFSFMVERFGPTFKGKKAYNNSLKWLVETIQHLQRAIEVMREQ